MHGGRVFAGDFSSCLIVRGGFNRLMGEKVTKRFVLGWALSRLPDRDGGWRNARYGKIYMSFYVSLLNWL